MPTFIDAAGNRFSTTSDGTYYGIDVDGNRYTFNPSVYLLGVTEVTAAGDEIFNVSESRANDSALARPVMAAFYLTAAPSSSGVTADYHAVDAQVTANHANADSNTRLYAMEGKTIFSPSSGTLGEMVAVFGSAQNSNAGTVTIATGVEGEVRNTGSGTISSAYGVRVGTGANSGGGAITTQYGLKVENQSLATTNYAIHTGTGRVRIQAGTAIPAGGGSATNGYQFSSTINFGVFYGSGAPTISVAKGSIYLRSDGSTTNDRLYVNTDGGTTWTAVTTVA